MATLHASLVTTDAVLALLQLDGTLVGDAVVPAGGGWADIPGQSEFNPYVILHTLTDNADGTLRNPYEIARILFQLSCVGASRRQAQWLADRERNVLLTSTLTVTGRRVMLVSYEAGLGTIREDVVGQPPIFQTADRYRLWTEPS